MKRILGIYSAPRPHWVGDGFPMRSLFDYQGLGRHLSPFLLLDHAPPTHFEPSEQPRGVGVHPHRGFETVTIVYQGEVAHRDSTGAGGVIGPGDVQWMTAGAGILHEEFHSPAFSLQGGIMEMVQLCSICPAGTRWRRRATRALRHPVSRWWICRRLQDSSGSLPVNSAVLRARPGPLRRWTCWICVWRRAPLWSCPPGRALPWPSYCSR